jgi:hypothetical protein
MLASTENGASPRLSFGTGIWFFSAKSEKVGPGFEGPVPPRRDHLDVRVERIGGELKANLVIALAGRAMGNRIGAGFFGDLDQPLGDQRTGNRGAEQVDAFINGIGSEHRERRSRE